MSKTTTLILLLAAGAAVFYFAVLRKPGGAAAIGPPPIPQKPQVTPTPPSTPWYEKLASAGATFAADYLNERD